MHIIFYVLHISIVFYVLHICLPCLLLARGREIKLSICMFLIFMICLVLFGTQSFYWKSLYVLCYAWVKGELLQSLSLIHAYITSWVCHHQKGEIVGPKTYYSSFDDDQIHTYITPWILSSSKRGDCWPICLSL